MITHSGARTRALYRWEDEDLCLRAAGQERLTKRQLVRLAQTIWFHEGWDHTPFPSITIKRMKGLSFSCGREIVLVPRDATRVILIHELVHARGYGDGAVMHPVSFVRQYIRLLSKYCRWSYDALSREAVHRGLLPKART